LTNNHHNKIVQKCDIWLFFNVYVVVEIIEGEFKILRILGKHRIDKRQSYV